MRVVCEIHESEDNCNVFNVCVFVKHKIIFKMITSANLNIINITCDNMCVFRRIDLHTVRTGSLCTVGHTLCDSIILSSIPKRHKQ